MDPKPRITPGQTLLIDADDTLWENNIYFERAIAGFINCLDHREHSPAAVRQTLNAVERETILTHGYGLGSFTHALLTCFERLSPAPMTSRAMTEEKRERIEGFARSIAEQEIELLPGVASTLAELATRHRLILMTKGCQAEQAGKLGRSGLESYFSAVEIVAEKDPATYCEVIERQRLGPRATNTLRNQGAPQNESARQERNSPQACCLQDCWMIGNSPKSDINPALAAGLNAVFVFHKDTWVLEHAALDPAPPGRQLIEIDAFAKLRALF